ncbi:hypothetical protein [Saccharothrix syringae]|uniref:Uncharacterized protein n=1 Tax=Saccharothrix syringae TaxID=103733 RepID=A0A5Q0H930_SACSY|nr:hypothetical protein [Saccharothrix syringae]QFZ22738.1 hypothetical protein EKG83_39690 [Saccharothrix syringae]
MVNDHVERVRTALLDLCEPLHDVFASAEQLRRERLPELGGGSYRWHATHTIRAYAHHILSTMDGELGDWTLSGNHAQNGALWMTDGSYRIRILHALNDSDVPPPGSNKARRAYYRQPRLDGMIPLFGEARDKLLVLWRIDPSTAAAGFRVVRPIGEWKLGSHAETDLDFPLPPTAAELADLAFEPTDDDLGLALPRDEEGDTDAGGFTG